MKKLLLILFLFLFHSQTFAAEPFVIAVLDPLAKQLACDCVAGFVQRDYRALTDQLRIVDANRFAGIELVFTGSLQAAIEKSSQKRVDMMIGKDSVVRRELQQMKLPAKAIARLTDQKGGTDFTGLVIVAAGDSAKSVSDLKKHKLLLGSPDCDEKHAAAIKLFAKHGISVPEKPDIADNCTEAGLAILENESEQPMATVVSDYALALIEGCQTIEKDSLRVLDKTEPVPYISVFVTTTDDAETLEILYTVLSTLEPKQLKALESKDGFVPYRTDKDKVPWDLVAVEEPESNSKN
jgi:ABC-type phosphate/phosphonate transport system substrate-binding protein